MLSTSELKDFVNSQHIITPNGNGEHKIYVFSLLVQLLRELHSRVNKMYL